MEKLFKDLKFGIRMLAKDRTFALAAVLTLALCIGANSAIFSVVDSVLLRALPFHESDRLALVYNSYPNAGAERAENGVPDYYDRLEHLAAFSEQALFDTASWTLGEGGTPERIRGMAVTPSLFRVLETRPLLGRLFSEEDGTLHNEDKVVLSYGLWQELFGGREDALGKDVRLDRRPFQVVGVLPDGFEFLVPEARLWTPLAFTDEQKSDAARHSNNWGMVARLADGATFEQAQAQQDALNALNLERFPHLREALENVGFHTVVVPLEKDLVADVRQVLYLLWGGVFFVLLIGCVNIANLVLVRGRTRLKELSVRSALGARLSDVSRQLVTEGLLLAGAGGALGLAVAAWILHAFRSLGLGELPKSSSIALDGRGVLAVALLSAAIGLVLGLLPVAQLRRADTYGILREEGRSGTGGRSAQRLRRTLAVAQVSLAFVLLIGAGLLLVSFRSVLAVDPGFRVDDVLTATVSLSGERYDDDARQRAFAGEALQSAAALPGVEKVGMTSNIPLGGSYSDSVIFAEGYVMSPGESVISPARSTVTPGYFEAMGIPLIAGRFFDQRDAEGALRSIIVDQRLARHFWPGEDPVGKRMYSPSSAEDLQKLPPEEERYTVVGVVGEITMRALVDDRTPVGAYYFPDAQDPRRRMTFALRTTADPDGVARDLRSAVARIDPELALYDVRRMSERLSEDLTSRRTPMVLALIFAGLALLLAALGLYGTLAYGVTQRTRELGIRLALGSGRNRILRLVLGEGLLILATGLTLGMVGAGALGRALRSQLHGVEALDPTVFLWVGAVLGSAALLAAWLPARRATRVDPVIVLTQE
ncbi:MAG: ABC transporter permease [Acidobacteria bacterium]|nr:ABC transporter permease [Acidobacteriota bacterium]